ncbi:MAG: hypothetical protein AB7E47_01975 [Desulfovibrionaceae bacterium]
MARFSSLGTMPKRPRAALNRPEGVSPLYFDRHDYDLIHIVRDVGARAGYTGLKRLLAPQLHPHGIKQLAATHGLRIAYAVAHLLRSLEAGEAEDRLDALRTVRDEVLATPQLGLRLNTGRLLLQIMKELIRSDNDPVRQLQLAHDFRMAVSGKPTFVLEQLERYHLIETPEEWNHLAFDDHVHDANTKGRKSATHLVMDAWIKGIRSLTVIYYNAVRPEVAAELLEAAAIMDVKVRIGIELCARFHGRFVRFIWVPKGLFDARSARAFLNQTGVQAFMERARQVSVYQRGYVFQALEAFNDRHRLTVNDHFGVALEPVALDEFMQFVGTGQISLFHLGNCIHQRLMALFQEKAASFASLSPEERERTRSLLTEMNLLDPLHVVERWLAPQANPDIPNPDVPGDDPAQPDMLRLDAPTLLRQVRDAHSQSRIRLTLAGLDAADVLELLYDCEGMITHLEVFNLKEHMHVRSSAWETILALQAALNDGSVVTLKRLIRGIVVEAEASGMDPGRLAKLRGILGGIARLRTFYARTRIKSSLGSDSTGQSCRMYGMGLVVEDTLPLRARKALRRTSGAAPVILPLGMEVYERITYKPGGESGLKRMAWRIPLLRRLTGRTVHEWKERAVRPAPVGRSNLRTLGGIHMPCGAGIDLEPKAAAKEAGRLPLAYMNSALLNLLKIFVGFVPAFLTFALTKDWWVLAYGGAFIWFGITGVRNVIQSVLGSGGLRRSPLLRWNDLVSWRRLSDSLLYTGFSVPLLDWLVKTILLEKGCGVTTASNPTLLYAVMALANGVYLTSHNLFRGLPKRVAFANFFRSVLSIPIAVACNSVAGALLGMAGVAAVDAVLQRWAAIISKLASDCVAGLIEGMTDRARNIRMRMWDYAVKLGQLFETHARLELQYPHADVLQLLESPREFIRGAMARDEAGGHGDTAGEEYGLEKVVIVSALDFLHIWMCQPRAPIALERCMRAMPQEERQIFLMSQYVLLRYEEISQLLVQGLVGKDFARALSFYLNTSAEYLDNIQQLAWKYSPEVSGARTLPKDFAGGVIRPGVGLEEGDLE